MVLPPGASLFGRELRLSALKVRTHRVLFDGGRVKRGWRGDRRGQISQAALYWSMWYVVLQRICEQRENHFFIKSSLYFSHLMSQDICHRDVLLSLEREFWPVGAHFVIVSQEALERKHCTSLLSFALPSCMINFSYPYEHYG